MRSIGKITPDAASNICLGFCLAINRNGTQTEVITIHEARARSRSREVRRQFGGLRVLQANRFGEYLLVASPDCLEFLTDYKTHKQLPEEDRFSEGLFTLRSACLIWRKDESRHRSKKKIGADQQEDQLKPWNTHRLYLHCTVDRRLLTAEGTEQVREEKKREVIEELKGKEKLEQTELHELGLTKQQIIYIKRRCSTLNRLRIIHPHLALRLYLMKGNLTSQLESVLVLMNLWLLPL
jgi:CRISPR/Cas system-associated exonuclease Cas4 (RecB family)